MNKIRKEGVLLIGILLILSLVSAGMFIGDEEIIGFNLEKVSDIYSEIESGELSADELVFLDEFGNEIEIENIREKQYKGEIYDVDVEKDIVLVERDGLIVWSGNSNNGTAQGDAKQIDAGYLGKGFEFDGNGDYVDLGTGMNLNLTTITVCAWSKTTDAGDWVERRIIQLRVSGGSREYDMVRRDAGDYLYIRVNDNTAFEYGNFGSHEWAHSCFTYNGTGGDAYINGVDIGDLLDKGSTANITGILIGSYFGSSTYDFNGTIDDVLIFNRSLSATEIQGLYADSSSKYVSAEFTGLSEGSHSFTSYAQDEGGNVNSSTLSFDVDLTYPYINFTSPTLANGSSTANTWIYVNVSANDSANNISTFIDFDNSLVGWWRMYDVNQTGEGALVYDKSGHCYDNETEILTLVEVDCDEINGDNYLNSINQDAEPNIDFNPVIVNPTILPVLSYLANIPEPKSIVNASFGLPNEIYNTSASPSYSHSTFPGFSTFNVSSILSSSFLACLNNKLSAQSRQLDQLLYKLQQAIYSEPQEFLETSLLQEEFLHLLSEPYQDCLLSQGYSLVNLSPQDALKIYAQSVLLATLSEHYSLKNLSSFNVYNSSEYINLMKNDNFSNREKCYLPKWKYFYELDKTEKVATLNQETKELEWQLPLEYQEFDYDDDMYKILLEDGSDLLVSEKHRVYADYGRDGTFESFALKPIKQVYEKFEQGKEIYFLNEDDEVIKVKSITKEPYSGKIYDVDVENDVVLVRRSDGSNIIIFDNQSELYELELLEDKYDNEDVYYIVEFNNTADDILPITGSGKDNNNAIILLFAFALLFVLAKRNVSVLDNKILEKRGGVR